MDSNGADPSYWNVFDMDLNGVDLASASLVFDMDLQVQALQSCCSVASVAAAR